MKTPSSLRAWLRGGIAGARARVASVVVLTFLSVVPTASATTNRVEPLSDLDKPSAGRPTVVLDQLTFPQEVVGAKDFERYLERVLRREAFRADWGAGSENRIEYRFEVTELRFSVEGRVLQIHCEAHGRLPRGQHARSELSFGGAVSERTALTRQVLEIVARGVITRLAQLERRRRGLR